MQSTELMLFVDIIPLRVVLARLNRTLKNLTFFLGNLKEKNRLRKKQLFKLSKLEMEKLKVVSLFPVENVSRLDSFFTL